MTLILKPFIILLKGIEIMVIVFCDDDRTIHDTIKLYLEQYSKENTLEKKYALLRSRQKLHVFGGLINPKC